MHSMSALAASATTSPPAIGGWGLAAVAAVVVYLIRKNGAASTASSTTTGWFRTLINGVKATARGIRSTYRAVRAVLRFLLGRELRGEPRSTATFLRAGTPLTTTQAAADQAVTMATIAAPPAKVSLTKKRRRQPSPWASNAATWVEGYDGRGAKTLDRTVRTALWAARWTGRAWRLLKAIWHGLKAVYGVVAPPVILLGRALRAWHCWPYAARSLVRIIGLALLASYLLPGRPLWTLAVALTALALLVPFARQLVPAKPGDDAIYGPRIWAVLRDDLGLPADEPREHWMVLPKSLAAPDARIVIRLPWTWRGSEGDRDNLHSLVNSRLPGDWVARISLTGETFTAVYTHKPAPKPPAPDPEPPAAVDIWDPKVQEILAALGPDEFFLGYDTFGQPVIQKMADEQAHWALSVGSGGGKSAFLQWLAVQMLMKRGTVIAIDPKMVSLTPLIGVEGVHDYVNPQAPQDMRATLKWVIQVVNARNYEKKKGTRTDFLPLYVFLEECNHLADILKEEYTANKESGAPAGDPIWRDAVASTLRLGREVNVHIIAVFQDFKDTQFGGVSLVPLFPFKILGSYREQQWKRIMGASFPMPPIQKKAGRMVLVTDTGDVTRIQTPYAPWDPELSKDENQKQAYSLLTAYYKELRETHGYSTAGLYVAPPKPSPEVAPAFIKALSRDESSHGPIGGSEGGASDETAGGLSHDDASVTAQEGDVTASRDRLRLIPGQGGHGASQDPTAPPELLALAEISRRLGPDQGVPKYDTLRQHKARRDDFPKGIEIGGKEHYTESQILAYYAAQEKEA